MNLTAGERIDPEYCRPLRVPTVIIVPVPVITLTEIHPFYGPFGRCLQIMQS